MSKVKSSEISKILNKISKKKFTTKTDLFLNNILDSMSTLHLISEIEKKFKIKISLSKISKKNFSTVEKIIKIVNI